MKFIPLAFVIFFLSSCIKKGEAPAPITNPNSSSSSSTSNPGEAGSGTSTGSTTETSTGSTAGTSTGTTTGTSAGSTTGTSTGSTTGTSTGSTAGTSTGSTTGTSTGSTTAPSALVKMGKQFSYAGAKAISTESEYISIGCKNSSSFNFCLSVIDKSGSLLKTISHGPKIANNPQKTDFTVVTDLASDNSGNLVIVGFTSQALGEALADTGSPTSARGDGFVAKYTKNGSLVWLKQFGAVTKGAAASKREEFHAVKVNSSNEIIIAGTTASNFSDTQSGGSDALLMKLAEDGSVIFSKQLGVNAFGSFSNKEEKFLAIDLDAAGNIYVGGHTNGDLLEPNSSSSSCGYNGAANGNCDWADIILFSYTSAGVQRWARQIGKLSATGVNAASQKTDFLNSLFVDALGNVFFTGAREVVSDFVVGKISPSGFLLWYKKLTGTNSSKTDSGQSIVDLGSNEFGVCGYTQGNFLEAQGGGAVGNGNNEGDGDIVLFRVSKDSGVVQGARQFGNVTLGSERSKEHDACGSMIKEGQYITLFGVTEGEIFSGDGEGFIARDHQDSFLNLLLGGD